MLPTPHARSRSVTPSHSARAMSTAYVYPLIGVGVFIALVQRARFMKKKRAAQAEEEERKAQLDAAPTDPFTTGVAPEVTHGQHQGMALPPYPPSYNEALSMIVNDDEYV